MKNFKDWNSIAEWQEELFKQWVPYAESKQYAIDNKLTFWDWKSVKMYTWWKTEDSWKWYHFKDWDDFRKKYDAIASQMENDNDWQNLTDIINSSDIWWININDLWWWDIIDMPAKQINRLIKQWTTDKWFDELMWYYDDEDNDQNEEIYNEILHSWDLSYDEKEKRLKDLKTKVNNTRISNIENADDDIGSLNEALEKNKKNEKLAGKLREWETWFLWQKVTNSSTITKNLTKNWLPVSEYNNYITQLQWIASSSESNRKKYFKTKRLQEERNKKINNLRVYYNNQYWDKPLSANKWKELTSDQKAEKKMIETYLDRCKMLNAKADAYIDSYWKYYFEWF